MARSKTRTAPAKRDDGATVGYEAQLWQMADALRGSMDAAQYKHVALGLLFLELVTLEYGKSLSGYGFRLSDSLDQSRRLLQPHGHVPAA